MLGPIGTRSSMFAWNWRDSLPRARQIRFMRYGPFTLLTVVSVLTLPAFSMAEPFASAGRTGLPSTQEVIDATASLAGNDAAERLADRYDLDFVNLTWEDTGRYQNSSVGPNISDMTIQVARSGLFPWSPKTGVAMPVLRPPNFSDRTTDLDPRQFTLLVGNENGQPLQRVSLRQFLENPAAFASHPEEWKDLPPLLAPRDSKVLVSAQACFLPVPRFGKATFNPVLFNYQSHEEDPAVLAIVATREGTSMTIIDNVRDSFGGARWGQRLFFNAGGNRASFTGTRASDFHRAKASSAEPGPESAGLHGLNMVLLIQVPLIQKTPRQPPTPASAALQKEVIVEEVSDVEAAVIGHGKIEGPFVELDGLEIRRDPRFPIRVTVQLYQATSNGVVNAEDVAELAAQIEAIYAEGELVGSLVTGGDTGRDTAYWGQQVRPANWWQAFWRRHRENTGQTPRQAKRTLARLLGAAYQSQPVSELYLTDLLRNSD